jgi:hypothetical protein
MSDNKFIKLKENFICANCEFKVIGNGYTNHCPKCLWSKHVDIHPGDRLNKCKGKMEPILVEFISKKYIIIHECQKCGEIKKNKISEDDDFEKVIDLTKQLSS